jgi:hypothetical protein
MNWPTSQDYNEAIQNDASSFSDPSLKSGTVTLNSLGLPVPRSGNFADVYQFKGGDSKMWAVKCFTRKVDGLQQRYLKIDAHLTKAKLPFTVGFKYFEEGIRVRGQWFPLLKMKWVEGFTLNEFVRDNADKPKYLHALMQMWSKLTARLRDSNFAHADLQHGNVLLVPGDAQNKLGMKLIDYDGMWVPALADAHSGEIGHPNFQHPLRLKNRLYNADVDRFPHLVVACALRATMIGGRALWDKFDNGDNLLFKEADIRDPGGAPVFAELWNLRDDVLCTLLGTMALASREQLRKTPWLDHLLLADGGPRLTADDEKKAIEMLGVAPHFTASKPAAVVQSSIQAEFGGFNFSDDPTDERPAAEEKKERKNSRLPYYIGGGAVALCLIGSIVALMAGGGNKNGPQQQEVAKNNANDDKAKAPVAPGKKDLTKAHPNDPKKVSPIAGKEITAPGEEKIADGGKQARIPGDVSELEVLGKKMVNGESTSTVAGADSDFLKPDNWEGMEGMWSIDGSTIVSKSVASGFETFFCTKKKYKDFELSFQVRLTNGQGNSGVQIRSRLDDPPRFQVSGPQADIGEEFWGDLHGCRLSQDGKLGGDSFKMSKADYKTLNVKPADFNDYSIKVVGKKVRIKVNGVVAVDQEFPILPNEGIIAMEYSRAGVTFKNIVLKPLNEIEDGPSRGPVVNTKPQPPDAAAAVKAGARGLWRSD